MFASESAKYAKRVIESNWSKYEMPPSDEEVTFTVQQAFALLQKIVPEEWPCESSTRRRWLAAEE